MRESDKLIGKAVTSAALLLGALASYLYSIWFPGMLGAFTIGAVVVLGFSVVWYARRAWCVLGEEIDCDLADDAELRVLRARVGQLVRDREQLQHRWDDVAREQQRRQQEALRNDG